jgi:hypothetical protein
MLQGSVALSAAPWDWKQKARLPKVPGLCFYRPNVLTKYNGPTVATRNRFGGPSKLQEGEVVTTGWPGLMLVLIVVPCLFVLAGLVWVLLRRWRG